jgi:hypothetical protein
MKRRTITALLTLMLAIGLAHVGFGQKAKKVKEKRFDPVVRQNLKDYEGTYTGIDSDFVIEVEAAADEQLRVRALEGGESVRVLNINVAGARLTADKIYANGRRGKLDATFVNRVLNGQTAFGMLVDGLNIQLDGGVTLNRIFYRRN